MEKKNDFHIYLDTNILLFGHPFRTDLIKLIEKYKSHKKIYLYFKVPQVVALEYKHKTSYYIKEKIRLYNEQINTLNYFLDKQITPYQSKEDLEKTILKDVFQNFNIEIVKTPVRKIKLNTLIEKAVKHTSPFEEKKEKGFRDSIIAETIHFTYDKDVTNIFVSEDNKLREYIDNSLSYFKGFKTFDSIKELDSYLNFHELNLDDEFIEQLTNKAQRAFYDPFQRSGLFFDKKIEISIKKEYPNMFQENYSKTYRAQHSHSHSYITDAYIRSLDELALTPSFSSEEIKYFIHRPYFVARNKSNEYTWNTLILFTQTTSPSASFSSSLSTSGSSSGHISPQTFFSAATSPSNRLPSQVVFSIKWKSIVNEEGFIDKCTLESINFHSQVI